MGKNPTKSAESRIGQRLRSVIKIKARSIREFADLVGIPYRTLHDYLKGNSEPRAAHLAKLSEAGVDISWLLTGMRPWAPALATALRRERKSSTGEGSEDEDLLYADTALMSMVWREALKLANEFHQRRIDGGARLLPVGELIVVTMYYFELILTVASKMSRRVVELLKLGVTPTEVVTMLSGGLGADHDAKLTAACKGDEWE